jgi:tetratricopeptide (TPR) repeat protein
MIMKKCPNCQEEFTDKATKCFYCGERLVTVSPRQKRTSVKHPKKRKNGTGSNDLQTKSWKIWNEYRIPIIAIIILVAGILFSISQTPNVSKNEKEIKAIESPKVYAPSAPVAETVPAAKPAPARESAPALESVNNLFNKAFMLCFSGKCTDPKKAIEYLNEVIKLKPDLAEAYNNRGNAYSDLGQYQRAIEDYNEAIHLKPDNAFAYNNRGLAYRDLGQHQHAIEDYNEAIRLKSDNAFAYNNRGVTYGDLGQYQRAIEDYNETIRIKPDGADAYHNRGNAYFEQANKSLGCQDAQKACELGDCKLLEFAKGKGYCR